MTGPVAMPDMAFRARPFVCGAIGPWSEQTLRRLLTSAPAGLSQAHTSAQAVVWSSHPVASWVSQHGSGLTWGELAEGGRPASWTDAAQARLAAGVHVTPEGAVLHTDAVGLQDVYFRQVGDAVYFAGRFEPLVDLTDDKLHTDWVNWADCLAITCPLGEGTPFQEIRRIGAASAVRAGAGAVSRLSFEPSWLSEELNPAITPADAVDVVAQYVSGGRGVGITLSGGWDSRLLAMLAHRRGRGVSAWTTSKDDGYDFDVQYAAPVAKALGMKYRQHIPGPQAWLEEHTKVWQRLSYQTYHHHVWLMPLIRVLHKRPLRYLDGLAGDVLFKGSSFAKAAGESAITPQERKRLTWNAFAQSRLRDRDVLAPGLAAMFEAMSRESFDRAVSRFDGHPDSGTLVAVHTRAARGIACSALSLLAPEVEVSLPFVHPEVMRVALSVPLSNKVSGDFYRAMMTAANPSVASLPSTNDGMTLGKTGQMRQNTPEALQAMARAVLADETAKRVLGGSVRHALKDPAGLSLIGKSWTGRRLLQWAAMLAHWRGVYGSRLADNGVLPS